jgi:hypothetical protein
MIDNKTKKQAKYNKSKCIKKSNNYHYFLLRFQYLLKVYREYLKLAQDTIC